MPVSALKKWTAIVAFLGAVITMVLNGDHLYRMYREYTSRGCDTRLAPGDRQFTRDRNDGEIRYSVLAGCSRLDPSPLQSIVEGTGERQPTKEEMPLDNYYEKAGPIVEGGRRYFIVGYHFSENHTGKLRKVVSSWLDETKGRVILTQNP